jgi:hypothetical protein
VFRESCPQHIVNSTRSRQRSAQSIRAAITAIDSNLSQYAAVHEDACGAGSGRNERSKGADRRQNSKKILEQAKDAAKSRDSERITKNLGKSAETAEEFS